MPATHFKWQHVTTYTEKTAEGKASARRLNMLMVAREFAKVPAGGWFLDLSEEVTPAEDDREWIKDLTTTVELRRRRKRT